MEKNALSIAYLETIQIQKREKENGAQLSTTAHHIEKINDHNDIIWWPQLARPLPPKKAITAVAMYLTKVAIETQVSFFIGHHPLC